MDETLAGRSGRGPDSPLSLQILLQYMMTVKRLTLKHLADPIIQGDLQCIHV